jgi:Bacterial PH domain
VGSVRVGRKKRADTVGGPQTFRSPAGMIIWWVWLLFAAANLVDLAVQGHDHASLVAAAILVLVTGVAYVAAQRPRIITDSAGVTVVNPLRDHHIGWAGVTKVDLADLLRIHYQEQGRDKAIYSWAVHYSRRRKFAAEAKARRTAARASSGRRSSFGAFGLRSYSGSDHSDLGYGSAPAGAAVSAPEAEAERIARVLSEYANTARAEAVWAGGTVAIAGDPESAGAASAREAPAGAPASAGAASASQIEPAEAPAVAEGGSTDPRVAGWLEPLTSTWNRTALLAVLIPALILLVVVLV